MLNRIKKFYIRLYPRFHFGVSRNLAQTYVEILRDERQKTNARLLEEIEDYDLDLGDATGIYEGETSNFLTTRGRAVVRRLVDEEKERRYKSFARSVKTIGLPIGLLLGILTLITALSKLWRYKP
jgi:hypothetical protein